MSLEHGRFSKRPSIKDRSPSMTLDVAFGKRSSPSHDIAKTFHGLPSMTIQKCPTPVPFTSKDRIAYQINGNTTMSKEQKMPKKDIWRGILLLVTCSIFKQLSLLFLKQTHTFQKYLTNIENIFKRSTSRYTFFRTRIITKIA